MKPEKEIKSLFEEFLDDYDAEQINLIWSQQSSKFKGFWNNKIINPNHKTLQEGEIDEVVRFLDSKALGNTKGSQSTAHAMITQDVWRQMFKEIKNDTSLSKTMTAIFTESNQSKKGDLIDELYKLNEGNKNNLTGKSGNAISAMIFVWDPSNHVSIVSLNDRKKLLDYFKFEGDLDFENDSIGKKIVTSKTLILRCLKSLGIDGSPRTISTFCYWPKMKGLWKKTNSKWSRDELLLVLHLYLKKPQSPPSKNSEEVKEMSEILGRLNSRLGEDTNSKFRNTNSVYMKMMNFRGLDGSIEAAGLTKRGKDEEEVWDLYSDKQKELSNIVTSIRKLIETNVELPPTIDEEEDLEEGKLRTRFHKFRERNTKTVKKKKDDFHKKNGRLYCEVCDFDFMEEYGSRGDGFIECHHTKFLSDYDESTKTNITDLVLLCSNCHRMIHRKKPWLSVDELRELFELEKKEGN